CDPAHLFGTGPRKSLTSNRNRIGVGRAVREHVVKTPGTRIDDDRARSFIVWKSDGLRGLRSNIRARAAGPHFGRLSLRPGRCFLLIIRIVVGIVILAAAIWRIRRVAPTPLIRSLILWCIVEDRLAIFP